MARMNRERRKKEALDRLIDRANMVDSDSVEVLCQHILLGKSHAWSMPFGQHIRIVMCKRCAHAALSDLREWAEARLGSAKESGYVSSD